MTPTPDTFTIVIDFKNETVGCAIIQSLYGATVSNYEIADVRWGLHPTDTMGLYEVNDDTRHYWEQLKEKWAA